MIEIGINNIVKNYGYNNVLNGTSFEIMTGDRAAIAGANGCGKTTIFNIIAGMDSPDNGTVSIRKGAVIGFLDQIPKQYNKDVTVKDILQESFSHLYAMEEKLRHIEKEMTAEKNPQTLEKLMNEYGRIQNHFIAEDGYAMTESFSKITEGFKLHSLLDRPFQKLSGGQKTVVMLAATVLKKPDILLLDEPTNHLDIKTLAWFEEFIRKYTGTVVFISHDRYFLDAVATKTILIEDGQSLIFNGNYSYSLEQREKLLMEEFEDYKNQQKKIDAMKAAIKRYRVWAAKGNNESLYKKAKELEKRLEKLDIINKPQLEKPKIPIKFTGDRTGKDVLILKDFTISFKDCCLFEAANMEIYQKEKVCLLGDNGTGKTTLVKSVLGDITDYSGKCSINPSAVLGYIPQEIYFQNEKATVLDAFRMEYPCTSGDARNILAKYFFFGENVFKSCGSLSGGEKVLLKLAVLVQNKVNFLLLDEPTNHIDIATREILEEALLDYSGTLLFISHDRYFINKIADKIVIINNKKLYSNIGNFDSLNL